MNNKPIEEEIRAVQDRLDRIRRDLRAPLDADLEDQAIQLQNREVLQELERVEAERLTTLKRQAATSKMKEDMED